MTNLLSGSKISWYPSCGMDFRSLLFLSPGYLETNSLPLELTPEIFVFTDFNPGREISITEGSILFRDERTSIRILKGEELAKTKYELWHDTLPFAEDIETIGRNVLLEVAVESNQYGSFQTSLLYSIQQNEIFFREFFQKDRIEVNSIVKIRYGGGAYNKGAWIKSVVKHLNSKYLISDDKLNLTIKDLRILERLGIENSRIDLNEIHCVSGSSWSNYGPVNWYSLS